MELREYRKRLSLNGNAGRSPPVNNGVSQYLAGKGLGGGAVSNPSDVNFQFEFPRFGHLPGPAATATGANATRNSASATTTTHQIPSPVEKGQVSPRDRSLQYTNAIAPTGGLNATPAQADMGDMSSLSGLFSPSLLDSVGKTPPFEYFANNNTSSNESRSSTDSAVGSGSTGHNTSYSSPSASSNSNQGASSSCGTSPEPTLQSPNCGGRASDSTLTPIGEEHSGISGEGELTFCDKLNMACGNPKNPVPRTMSEPSVYSGNFDAHFDNPALDINGIDWFAQQNGNQFDPQLFGDYREPHDNILLGDTFNDSFFSDAYPVHEFNTPFNAEPSPIPPKKDLLTQLDKEQEEDEEVVPGEDRSTMLTCNTIWYVSLKLLLLTPKR